MDTDLVYTLIRGTLMAIINLMQIAMFLRALLSWFDPMGEGRFSAFLYVITEPLILPVRKLFEARHWMEGVPLDIPFFVVLLLLMLLEALVTFL